MKPLNQINNYRQIINKNAHTNNGNKSLNDINKQTLYQVKDNVDITLPKNLVGKPTKVLNCQDGSKAIMSFDEKTKKVSCYVQNVVGEITAIKTENLPQSLNKIDTVEKFNGFLSNAYAKTSLVSDNVKVDVLQKLKGCGSTSSSCNKYDGGVRWGSPMRKVTEKNLGTTIERGDILNHTSSCVSHSSVYLGKDVVIGVTKEGGRGVVKKAYIETDKVNYKYSRSSDFWYTLYCKEDVATRAESKLGKSTEYDTWYHNCHNFTNWCATGVDYNSFGKSANKGIFFKYETWDDV